MITEIKRRPLLPYLVAAAILFYLGQGLAKLYQLAPAGSVHDVFGLEKLSWTLDNLGLFPWLDLSVTNQSLLTGATFAFVALLLYMRVKHTGTYRYGEEHGSARYATKEELISLRDQDEDKNMLFTENAQMGLFNKRLPYDKQINKNVLVIGGTGDWKTRSFVKPNLLQANSSFVTTDTKGMLIHETGQFLQNQGYAVKIFDLINLTNSDSFNVFKYMSKETDIDRVAEAIVTATKRSNNQGEDFWIQAEMLLMRALIGYLYFDGKVSGYLPSLPQVMDLIRVLERTDPDVPSVLELLFEDLETDLPGNYANKQWQSFNKNFSGETRKSVLAIISSRFAVFDHDDVRKLVERDTLEIETWNVKKTAVFINIPEVNPAYQFLSALLFSTMFDVTFKTADDVLKGLRPDVSELLHLQVEADEVAQVGKIPNLPQIISVIRSREISIKLMIQSTSQMEELYGKDNTKTIFNNCGTILYLGSNDKDTLEYLSQRSGKMTINDRNQSETRSRNGSSSTQHSKIGRDLLTPHEVATIGTTEALVFISKHNVFRDKKLILERHKNAAALSDHPGDGKWYRYIRHMSDIDEFLDGVKPSHLVEVTLEEIDQLAKVA